MKIGEFSKLVGLSISTLRYYEDQGFLHIERQNGIRNYRAEDVGFVQFIKRLKDMGMPLAPLLVGVVFGARGMWHLGWSVCIVISLLSILACFLLLGNKKVRGK